MTNRASVTRFAALGGIVPALFVACLPARTSAPVNPNDIEPSCPVLRVHPGVVTGGPDARDVDDVWCLFDSPGFDPSGTATAVVRLQVPAPWPLKTDAERWWYQMPRRVEAVPPDTPSGAAWTPSAVSPAICQGCLPSDITAACQFACPHREPIEPLASGLDRLARQCASVVVGWPGRWIAGKTWTRGDEATLIEPALASLVSLTRDDPRDKPTTDSAWEHRVGARFEGARSEPWGDALVFGVRVETTRSVPAYNITRTGELVLRARDGAFVALHSGDTFAARWTDCGKGVLVRAP